MKKPGIVVCLLAGVALATSACGTKAASGQVEPAPQPSVSVNLMNAEGKKIGTAVLTEVPGGVKVAVEAANLRPGKHGIHFHETGVCQGPDFKSAGAHFNPMGKKHGLENPEGPHAGDLPNLEVGADGKAKTEFVTKLVTLTPGKPNSLIRTGGTALVIHLQPDDQRTEPSGNAGDRIACGVIGDIAKHAP